MDLTRFTRPKQLPRPLWNPDLDCTPSELITELKLPSLVFYVMVPFFFLIVHPHQHALELVRCINVYFFQHQIL